MDTNNVNVFKKKIEDNRDLWGKYNPVFWKFEYSDKNFNKKLKTNRLPRNIGEHYRSNKITKLSVEQKAVETKMNIENNGNWKDDIDNFDKNIQIIRQKEVSTTISNKIAKPSVEQKAVETKVSEEYNEDDSYYNDYNDFVNEEDIKELENQEINLEDKKIQFKPIFTKNNFNKNKVNNGQNLKRSVIKKEDKILYKKELLDKDFKQQEKKQIEKEVLGAINKMNVLNIKVNKQNKLNQKNNKGININSKNNSAMKEVFFLTKDTKLQRKNYIKDGDIIFDKNKEDRNKLNQEDKKNINTNQKHHNAMNETLFLERKKDRKNKLQRKNCIKVDISTNRNKNIINNNINELSKKFSNIDYGEFDKLVSQNCKQTSNKQI